MTILVTGGTGFLGKSLVRRLLDEGRSVRVLVRDEGRLDGLPRERLEVRRGDLREERTLAEAVAGAEVLIHAAALVKRWTRDRGDFERINVTATGQILRLAMASGVRRILYVSSFFALGCSDAAPASIADETSVRDAGHMHTEYERTKYLAALETRRLAQDGAPIVMVYPGVIYGPGELTEGNIVGAMLREHLRGKLPGIPGSGKKKWTYAFIDDVVDGILRALERGAPGEGYILGGQSASAREFFAIFQEVSGRRPPRWRIPLALLIPLAWFEELKAHRCGIDPRLTRAEVATYRHHWAYDSAKACRELGYHPRSLRAGLEETYRWLIAEDPDLEDRR